MSLSWTTGRIATAVSGVLVGDPEVGMSSVTTDSRHALPGSVFVALEGERFDGNRYAAATATGLALDVDLDTICARLVRAVGSPWRMEIHRGRFTVVNDAYNANPDSVLAALETVASMPGRHVAVLGRMAQLGPVEAEEHRKVGTFARRLGYAAVVTVGSDPGLATGAGDIAHATGEVDEAFDVVTRLIRPGDVVLVKASRAVGLEALAERLATEAAS